MKWAELRYGEKFMKFLVDNYHPLQIVFALATFHSIVLLERKRLRRSGLVGPRVARELAGHRPTRRSVPISSDVAKTAYERWQREG